ncbi:MAG: tol-pal system protein YbgF [Pseudomonadota bacterium]
MFGAAAPAFSQSNDIKNRLNQLENEIQTLNRAVYRGEPLPEPAYNSPTPMPTDNRIQSDNLVRLQQLEQDLRDLTGRVEEQAFEMQQLRTRLDTMEASQASNAATPVRTQQAPFGQQPYQTAPSAGGGFQYVDPSGISNNQQTLSQPNPVFQPPQPQPAAIQPQVMDPAGLYETSFSILKSGDYDAAEKSFQAFLDKYPDHTLASNATYWLGETYYVRNRYDDAARLFAQSYQNFPSGSKTPDSLLKLGLSLNGLGKKQEACIALTQLISEFPGAGASILQRADREMQNLGC